jgi:hypothetical protein
VLITTAIIADVSTGPGKTWCIRVSFIPRFLSSIVWGTSTDSKKLMFLGGRAPLAHKADNLTANCEPISRQCGILDISQPGPVTGTVLLYAFSRFPRFWTQLILRKRRSHTAAQRIDPVLAWRGPSRHTDRTDRPVVTPFVLRARTCHQKERKFTVEYVLYETSGA